MFQLRYSIQNFLYISTISVTSFTFGHSSCINNITTRIVLFKIISGELVMTHFILYDAESYCFSEHIQPLLRFNFLSQLKHYCNFMSNQRKHVIWNVVVLSFADIFLHILTKSVCAYFNYRGIQKYNNKQQFTQ